MASNPCPLLACAWEGICSRGALMPGQPRSLPPPSMPRRLSLVWSSAVGGGGAQKVKLDQQGTPWTGSGCSEGARGGGISSPRSSSQFTPVSTHTPGTTPPPSSGSRRTGCSSLCPKAAPPPTAASRSSCLARTGGGGACRWDQRSARFCIPAPFPSQKRPCEAAARSREPRSARLEPGWLQNCGKRKDPATPLPPRSSTGQPSPRKQEASLLQPGCVPRVEADSSAMTPRAGPAPPEVA